MTIVKCEDCLRELEPDEQVECSDDKIRCESCSEVVGQCVHCSGDVFINEEYTKFDRTEYIHQHCLDTSDWDISECEHCRTMVSDRRDTADGVGLCGECWDYQVTYCEDCNCAFYHDNMTQYDEESDIYVCNDCWRGSNMTTEIISGYHGSGAGNRRLGGESGVIIGIELELPFPRGKGADFASDLRTATGTSQRTGAHYFYFERDSSIPDDGVEVITPKLNINYYRQYHRARFDTLCEVARKYDSTLDERTGCGLHVTISGEPNVANATLNSSELIRNNLCAIGMVFEKELFALSGRQDEELNWCSKFHNNTGKPIYDSIKSNSYGDGRYRIINMTHSNRFEFRLWKSSLEPEVIDASVELTYILYTIACHADTRRIVSSQTLDRLLTKHGYGDYVKYINVLKEKYGD